MLRSLSQPLLPGIIVFPLLLTICTFLFNLTTASGEPNLAVFWVRGVAPKASADSDVRLDELVAGRADRFGCHFNTHDDSFLSQV